MKQVVFFLMLFGCLQVSAAENLILVQFSNDDYTTTLSRLAELESRGATARHIFPPNLAIVNAYDLPVGFLDDGAENYSVYLRSDLLSDEGLLAGIPARSAFLHLTDDVIGLPPEGLVIPEPPQED